MAIGFTMTGPTSKPSQDFLDEQDWTRKKRKQETDMAIARQRAFPRPERDPSTGGALGIGGLGKQINSASIAKPISYPTPSDLPEYNSLAEKQQAQKDAFTNIQKPGFGMGYSVKPNVPKSPTGDIGGTEVLANQPLRDSYADTSDLENPIMNEMSRGNSGKGFGFSEDKNPAVAKPLAPAMGGGNSGFGFRVMPPPRKAYGEDSRRQALAMDIKPYKNGDRLTIGQIALKNSILLGDDEKYANEQYTTQMGAAQGLAQEGMQQSGANSRAELGERGANSRASQQLGFDAEKFQQVAALDKRKLDMQQTNDGVSNFLPKRLNGLYEKYDAAETDEERTAIATQIQSLSGNNGKSDKEYWTSIGGGETLSADGLTSIKNPDVLLNRNTGETRAIPTEPIDYETDPRAQAIINNRDLSKEERRKQLEALR